MRIRIDGIVFHGAEVSNARYGYVLVTFKCGTSHWYRAVEVEVLI